VTNSVSFIIIDDGLCGDFQDCISRTVHISELFRRRVGFVHPINVSCDAVPSEIAETKEKEVQTKS